MNIETIGFRIVGIAPLMQSNRKSMRHGSEGAKTKKIPKPKEEALAGAYFMPNGQAYHPAEAFRGALVSASVGYKFGKLGAKRVIQGSVSVLGELHPESADVVALLFHPKTGKPLKKYVIDVRRVVVQKQGVLRARPRYDQWSTEIAFEYNTELLPREDLLKFMELAGRMGVGELRPVCECGKGGGWFGRFKTEVID